MNKYEIRTEQKKAAIVTAAIELFNQKGFFATSIKDIASLAHVSQVSIYNYFGSKEALLGECAHLIMKRVHIKAMDILEEPYSFQERLNHALDLCSSQIQVDLHQTFSKVALSDPSLLTPLTDSINSLKVEIFREYIEAGKIEGAIDDSLSTDIILKYMAAINHFAFDLHHIREEQEAVHRLFLYGLIGH